MAVKNTVASRTLESEKLSLKEFLSAQSNNALAFTGEVTAKGNPIFTNNVESYPIALPLLKYYMRREMISIDDDDNIVCEQGWRSKDDTWQPKTKLNTEL